MSLDVDKLKIAAGRIDSLLRRIDAKKPTKVPSLFRHVTSEKNIPSIRQHGLRATTDYIMEDMPKGVNFMANEAEDFFEHTHTPHPIHVDAKNLDQKKLRNMGEGWWRYEGSVPPQHLKFKK